MKKIFTLLSLIALLIGCGPITKREIKPSKNVFSIVLIESVKDSSGTYSKYHIEMKDTLHDGNGCNCHIESAGFVIIDTAGKYDVSDKLILTLQPDTTIQTEE